MYNFIGTAQQKQAQSQSAASPSIYMPLNPFPTARTPPPLRGMTQWWYSWCSPRNTQYCSSESSHFPMRCKNSCKNACKSPRIMIPWCIAIIRVCKGDTAALPEPWAVASPETQSRLPAGTTATNVACKHMMYDPARSSAAGAFRLPANPAKPGTSALLLPGRMGLEAKAGRGPYARPAPAPLPTIHNHSVPSAPCTHI